MIKEKIKEFIAKIIADDELIITNDLALYSAGLMNSMAHLKLIRFLERTFRISIPAAELRMDNFDTLDQISALVESKIQPITGAS